MAVLGIAIILLACGCVQKGDNSNTTSNQLPSATSNQLPSQYILLNRSAGLSNYVGDYATASQGKTFLVINMTLENHGYQSFSVNPNYFAVVIDNVAYPYDSSTFSTKSPLTSATLLDGGKTAGYLVYQVPKGTATYSLRYVGSGDYQFIYGKLVEVQTQAPQEKPQPKLPGRAMTFNLGMGDGVQTLNPASIVSQAGAIIQTATIDSGDNGYATIEVKTSQEAINKDQAINDALKLEKINDVSTIEAGIYEATLPNGESVTVHSRNGYSGKFAVAAFMPDSTTVVKVTSTMDKNRVQALLGSLKIGEISPTS